MRYLTPELEAKLKLAMQTAYNNAEPKMEVYLGQAGDLLSALARFRVITIRENTGLGKLDVGVKRPDKDLRPTEMHIAYIQDGVAKVCYQPMPITADAEWIEVYTVGPAVDVALEFDGRWVKHEGGQGSYTYHDPMRFLLQTDGDPWVFWVTAAGALYGKQGASGQVVELVPDGVTGVSAIRGWKNLEIGDIDQGIIVAYIRAGQVCYRNYAEQADGSIIWEAERVISEIPAGAEWVTSFNTHDYRTGIAAKVGADDHYVLTDRAWAVMAINPEYVSARVTGFTMRLLPITYYDTYETEHVTARVTDLLFALLYGGPHHISSMSNPDAFSIAVEFDHDLFGTLTGQEAAWAVVDGNSVSWPVTATAAGANNKQIVLTLADFNNAAGDLSVSYDGAVGTIKNEAGYSINSVFDSFAPVGLVPTVKPAPSPISLYNYDSEGYGLRIEFDDALIADPAGNEAKLIVSFDEWNGVETKRKTVNVQSAQFAPGDSVSAAPSWESGILNRVATSGSKLRLAAREV